jgi:hypothetical protein
MIDKWKDLAASEPDSSRRTDYAALAIVFASVMKKRDVWRIALKEWNMIESPVTKEWENVGRREQIMELILDVLRDKFGEVPADVSSHLEAIDDLSILRKLHLPAFHASSLEDFRKLIPNGTHNGKAA